MTRKHYLLPAIAIAIILTACNGMPGSNGAPQLQTLTYECGDDFSFTAHVTDSQAQLFLPEKTLTLPRMADMKGQRYISEDRKILFLRKGDNAVLATGAGHDMLRCNLAAGKQ